MSRTNYPSSLQPTESLSVSLPTGNTVLLPVCKRNFAPWLGDPGFTFGGKPLVDFGGERCFAELAILRLLHLDGWHGVWVEAYGGRHFLNAMPSAWKLVSHVKLPTEREVVLTMIKEKGGTSACFDILAWQGAELLLAEAKRAKKDKLTEPQHRFIAGALECGISAEQMLIVEWDYEVQ